MKKIMAVLTILMCLASTNVFAQEVRGIETRRVEYTGTAYYPNGNIRYSNTTMYGFEFHNANSIKVSVDIELYNGSTLITTKSIVLNPNETYVFKQESIQGFCKCEQNTQFYCCNINDFYVRYKAYRLQ